MRWGLPFDGSWTYGDALFIIDPWIWIVLGSAVFLTSSPSRRGNWGWALLGLLTTALVVLGMGGVPAIVWVAGVAAVLVLRIRSGSTLREARPRAVRGALAFSAVYIVLMIAADVGARRDVVATAAAEGLEVRDVLVAPTRGNPFLADVEVLTEDAFVPGSHDWRRAPRVLLRPHDAVPLLSAPGLEGSTVSRVVAAARAREPIDDYLVWSRYPYVRVTPEANGWRVSFRDARYDDQPEAGGLAGLSVLVLRSEIQ
jgi:inner membrane protein